MASETGPCPQCRKNGRDESGNNLVTHPKYNYRKCFACNYYEAINAPLEGKYIDIFDRKLTKATCEKYGIQVVSYTGSFNTKHGLEAVTDERCAIFNTYEKGQVIRQKVRSLDNKQYMKLLGTNTKDKSLWGKHTCSPTKKLPITITEGEFDAAAVFQATGMPAVSIPNGAGNVGETLTRELSWLQEWKHVVLMFDNDEAGAEAVDKALSVLPVGQVRIAKLPYKDANEMLKEGKEAELKTCLWNAETYKPECIVTISDIIDEVLKKPEYGYSLPWDFLNEGTYGLQPNNIYVWLGAPQVGKTEAMKEVIFHLLEVEKVKVGMFCLEQGSANSVQRMVATKVNKRLHLPSNEWWNEDEIRAHAMELEGRLHLYQNSSSSGITLDSLLINIRYMYYCFGIKVIVIDNLTALCNTPIIDGKYVRDWVFTDYVADKLHALSRELPLSIILVAHTSKDRISKQIHIPTSKKNKESYLMIGEVQMDEMINRPGMDWNSGRMPGLEHIDGGDRIGRLADYVIGLARDTVSKNDVIRRTLKVKFLKTRLASEHCGKEYKLMYDYETGRYS
jgi:twinkle protein